MNSKWTIVFFLFILSLPFSLIAQSAEGCDGIRYYQEVFTDISKTTVQFGENTNPQGNTQALYMDVYEPDGDQLSKRPLIVLAFGGAFVAGQRSDMAAYCRGFAKRGYIAATIDYRIWNILLQGIPDSVDMMDLAIKAVSDMKAAVRHFRQDADTDNVFKIDTNFIFVGGLSAGAITALHTAYLDADDEIPDYMQDLVDANGGLEGNSGDATNLNYSSEVHGVLNMSGALHRKDWLGAGDPPLASYHGTEDEVVPFFQGRAKVFGFEFMTLHGSGNLKAQADAVGVENMLVEAPGAGHEDAYTSAAFNVYFDEFIGRYFQFFHEIICDGLMVATEEQQASPFNIVLAPNPASEVLHVSVETPFTSLEAILFDSLGKMIWQSVDSSAGSFSIEKRLVGSGVFWLKVQGEDGAYAIQKVIFQ